MEVKFIAHSISTAEFKSVWCVHEKESNEHVGSLFYLGEDVWRVGDNTQANKQFTAVGSDAAYDTAREFFKDKTLEQLAEKDDELPNDAKAAILEHADNMLNVLSQLMGRNGLQAEFIKILSGGLALIMASNARSDDARELLYVAVMKGIRETMDAAVLENKSNDNGLGTMLKQLVEMVARQEGVNPEDVKVATMGMAGPSGIQEVKVADLDFSGKKYH